MTAPFHPLGSATWGRPQKPYAPTASGPTTTSKASAAWRVSRTRPSALEQSGRASPETLAEVTSEGAREREALGGVLGELNAWESLAKEHSTGKLTFRVRDREHSVDLRRETLSGLALPRVAVPKFESQAERLRFVREENLPGRFPFTGGVFPTKRDDEMPTRQFAGEGTPARHQPTLPPALRRSAGEANQCRVRQRDALWRRS